MFWDIFYWLSCFVSPCPPDSYDRGSPWLAQTEKSFCLSILGGPLSEEMSDTGRDKAGKPGVNYHQLNNKKAKSSPKQSSTEFRRRQKTCPAANCATRAGFDIIS